MPDTQARFVRMQALQDWSLVALLILVVAAVWPTIFVLLGALGGDEANETYHTCTNNRHEAEAWDGSDGFEGARSTVVPLSEICSWDDGYTLEIVPGWVNPVVGTFVASFSLATAGAITGAVMSRRSKSDA
jgi:hypothetical protein